MTLAEWRSQTVFVQEARAFFETNFGKEILQLLEDESPWKRSPFMVNEKIRGDIQFGQVQGYQSAISVLRGTIKHTEVNQELPEATYESTNLQGE